MEEQKDVVMDAKVQNEGNGWAGSGANPWHLDGQTESYLFLTDMGEQSARIGFKVYANGQVYYLGSLQLIPHETRMIDVRKLRDAQQADLEKRTIPAGATDGSLLWLRLDGAPVMGRLAVVTRQGGVSSSYDCCYCVCPGIYEYTTILPGTACPVLVTNTDQLSAQAWFEPLCQGSWYYYDETDYSTWSSTNTSIFTVNNSSPIGLLKAVGGGSATANSQGPSECTSWVYTGGHCQCSFSQGSGGGASCRVVPYISSISPTYAMVGSSNVQITINGTGFASNATVNLPSGFTASSGCTPGNSVTSTKIVTCVNISVNRAIQAVSFSVTNNPGNSNNVAFTADGPVTLAVVSDNWSNNARQITYSVATLAGQEIPGISIGEVVTTSNCNCTGGCPGLSFDACGGSLTTSLLSDIPDSWSFPSGSTPVGCGLNIVDHWQWCGTGAPTGGWTIGSPSGYIHTNASSISGYVMPGNPMPPGLVIAP